MSTLKPCGTVAAYRRHGYHGSPACDPCKDANAAKSARDRGGRHRVRGRYKLGITDCIIDVISSECRRIRPDLVVDLVMDLHPDWKPESVHRIVWRLRQQGRLDSRIGPDGLVEVFTDEWAPGA